MMRRLPAALPVTLLLWLWTSGAAASGPAPYKVYFLGGQSNMDGYGHVDDLPDSIRNKKSPVMIFTGRTVLDDDASGGVGKWEPLRPGHGTGFRTDGKTNRPSDRFGPELTFGTTIAKMWPESRVALVKYSLGGSGLALGVGYGNWHPDYAGKTDLNQYDHALAALRNALEARDLDGDGAADSLVPAGIVWMQGEADAHHSSASATAYADNLKRMMDLLRAALRVDDLPVVIGRITDSGMNEAGALMPWADTVRTQQAAFVDSDACAALVTDTDDYGFNPDGWHYDSEGYLKMGVAFAKAMKSLESDCGHAPGAPAAGP